MISLETKAAVATLQQRADAQSALDVFELDRIDRALDQLIAHPTNTKPTPWQIRDSLANAAKVLKGRRARDAFYLDDPDLHEGERILAEHAQARVTVSTRSVETFGIFWWLATSPSLGEDERSILFLLSQGEDATTLAARAGISVKSMREWISRVRRAGRIAYANEVGF